MWLFVDGFVGQLQVAYWSCEIIIIVKEQRRGKEGCELNTTAHKAVLGGHCRYIKIGLLHCRRLSRTHKAVGYAVDHHNAAQGVGLAGPVNRRIVGEFIGG